MAARFVSIDRDTPMLLPPDLREQVPEEDLVHFVIEADRLPLESFRVNHRCTGLKQPPFSPINFTQFRSARPFRQKQIPSSHPRSASKCVLKDLPTKANS